MGAKNRQKIGEKFGGYLKNPYLCNGFRDETYFHNIFNNSKVFTMSKKDYLERVNAEKAAKKVAIAKTDINKNYTAQSAEYKAFRCKVNQWQKECRDYFNAEYNLPFKGCFRFEVISGTFKITEVGKVFMTKISEEDTNDLKAEMAEMEAEFLASVCKK